VGTTGENTFSGWSSGQRSVNWPARRLKRVEGCHDDDAGANFKTHFTLVRSCLEVFNLEGLEVHCWSLRDFFGPLANQCIHESLPKL